MCEWYSCPALSFQVVYMDVVPGADVGGGSADDDAVLHDFLSGCHVPQRDLVAPRNRCGDVERHGCRLIEEARETGTGINIPHRDGDSVSITVCEEIQSVVCHIVTPSLW